VDGVCTACPAGEASCPFPYADDHVCYDLATSIENCGRCGAMCTDFAAGMTCINGTCVCGGEEAHEITCGGPEFYHCYDPMTSVQHCGRCDNACVEGEACVQGVCGACPAGQVSCSGKCTPWDTELHCGGCWTSCAWDERCDASGETPRCVACPPGQRGCDGRCVNLANDNSNCGYCGRECAAGSNCVDGQCTDPVSQCAAPREQCGDDCVNPQNDNRHCGGCDVQCPAGTNCVAGQCV
jgi:hypothetical protein